MDSVVMAGPVAGLGVPVVGAVVGAGRDVVAGVREDTGTVVWRPDFLVIVRRLEKGRRVVCAEALERLSGVVYVCLRLAMAWKGRREMICVLAA